MNLKDEIQKIIDRETDCIIGAEDAAQSLTTLLEQKLVEAKEQGWQEARKFYNEHGYIKGGRH